MTGLKEKKEIQVVQKYKVNNKTIDRSIDCIFILLVAAILTVRIHNLNNHLNQHRKDKHNYKQLRTMVHDRAKILKYLKSKNPERYYSCLEQLGLQPRAVEGELTL